VPSAGTYPECTDGGADAPKDVAVDTSSTDASTFDAGADAGSLSYNGGLAPSRPTPSYYAEPDPRTSGSRWMWRREAREGAMMSARVWC
jgi:hypothetical protein